MLYKWKKELFEGALETFSRKHKKCSNNKDLMTKALEENIKLKKIKVRRFKPKVCRTGCSEWCCVLYNG